MFNVIKSDCLYFSNTIKTLFTQKNGVKYFFFIIATYLLGYTALIRANVYYLDDLRRVLRANVGWDNFSRYSSDFIAKWINMNGGENLVTLDISPLTQCIAIVFLSAASLILLRLFKVKSIYTSLLATSVIGLSPFFLENMSYKMDSPYMSLAVLAAIFPFLFSENKKLFSITGIFSLLLMYTTYQPANAVFILVAIFLFLDDYLETKNIKNALRTLFYAAVIFIIATLIYKFFILKEVNDYVSSHMLSSDKLLAGLKYNVHYYFYILYDHFKQTILFKLVAFAVVTLPVVILFNKKKIGAVLFSIISLVIAALFSYGLYSVLDKPLFDARALNGVGVLLALVLVLLIKYSEKFWNGLYKLVTIAVVYNLFVISFAYGNGLFAQYQFNEFRANSLIYQLNSEFVDIKKYNVYIANDKIIAPRTELARKEFPVLNMLIQEENQGHRIWTALFNYWGKAEYNFVINHCANNSVPVVKQIDTDMYTVTAYSNYCLVVNYKNY